MFHARGSLFEKFFRARIGAQRVEGVVQARFYRTQRDFERAGNFAEAEAIDKTEQQHFAMFFGQMGHHGGELVAFSERNFYRRCVVDFQQLLLAGLIALIFLRAAMERLRIAGQRNVFICAVRRNPGNFLTR